jgi:hypothetical protein
MKKYKIAQWIVFLILLTDLSAKAQVNQSSTVDICIYGEALLV